MRHSVRNQPFHRRACQMQSPEHAIQWYIRKHLTGIEEDIDDTRMRTGTEDDDTLRLHMNRYVAFIHDQRIRLPWLVGGPSTEMIRASFFKARYPGNLTAHIETIIQEKPRCTAVDHLRTMRQKILRRGDALKRCNVTGRQGCGALQKHPRVHVARPPAD